MVLSAMFSLLVVAAPPRVAVDELSGWGDSELRAALTAQLRSAMGRAGVFTLIAAEEQASLDEVLVKRLEEGCDDECLEAIGAALHAEQLLRSRLGRVGGSTTLDLKLIDLKSHKTLRSASRRVDGAPEDLLPLIDGLAAEISGLESMPMDEVDGIALLPLQAADASAKDQVAWAATVVSATDRTGRFRAIIADERLKRRLKKGLIKQAAACGEENCVASIAKAVKLPYAMMVSVEASAELYRVTALIARAKDSKRMALETMTAPDRHSVPSALRAVLTSAVTRSFDPDAPQLHSAMKVSVIAGVDPKLRAKRRMLLRYGGYTVIAVGAGLGGLGYVQTVGAAGKLDSATGDEWADLWQQGESGQSMQLAGVGVVAAGAALTIWSFVQ